MRSSDHNASKLELAQKILWVSGLAGLFGFVLGTAIGLLGGEQGEVKSAAKQVHRSSASVPLVRLQQRQDRLDRTEQQGAKTDLLLEIMPASEGVHHLKKAPIAAVEILSTPEAKEPRSLAAWLEDEATVDTLTTAADRGPVVLIAPDAIEDETERPVPLASEAAGSPQHSPTATTGEAGEAAPGLAGEATDALGL